MRKRKTALIIIITLIVLLVLASGACAALYFTTDLFKSNEERFWKYFSKNLDAFNVIKNENLDLQNQFKKQNSYVTNGTFTISSQTGTESPQQINVATTLKHDANTGRTYADATLQKESNNLLTVSYINSNDVYAIKCDNVYQNYIGFRNSNLKELAKNMGVPEDQLGEIPDSINFDLNLNLDSNKNDDTKTTYFDKLLENIPKENYQNLGKEQISSNGVAYNANKYSLTLDEQTVKQVLTDFLTFIKEDPTALNDFNNTMLDIDSQYDVNNTVESINDMISDIQENLTMENAATITVYEQAGQTVKTEIDFVTVKFTMDLSASEVVLLIETHDTSNTLTANTEVQEPQNQTMQITFNKAQGNEITNSISIVPDINHPEQSITISVTLGNTQSASINNSYLISVNNVVENVATTQSISFDTLTTAGEVEEIMELKNSNTVIINNYQLQQLQAFFNSLSPKIEQVLASALQALQQ